MRQVTRRMSRPRPQHFSPNHMRADRAWSPGPVSSIDTKTMFVTAAHRFCPVSILIVLSACAYQPVGGPEPRQNRAALPENSASAPSAEREREGARTLFDETSSEDPKSSPVERIVERGTGSRLGQSNAPEQRLSRNDAGDIILNVVDADVREVVRLVLEEGLDANYVIDPAVSGTITVRTSRPLPAEDVLPTLDSVLNLNGAALIDEGGFYKIVPLEQALGSGIEPRIRSVASGAEQGFGIQIIPIKYAAASELANLLQPFVTGGASLQVDAGRNTLLLVGSADQLTTLTDLIDVFDVDWVKGMSFGLFPLEEVNAIVLADELDQLFRGTEEGGVPPDVLRFVPIDRLNAILTITAQPDYLTRVEAWIKRLDKAGDGTGEQVYVYSVQNGRAADLAAVISEVFDVRSTSVGQPPPLLAPGLEPVELQSSFPDNLAARGGDDATTGDGDNRNAFPEPQPGFSSQGARQDRFDETDDGNVGTRIVADETNNSLLILATAADYRKIEEALRKLDVEPLQVLLEATIAEVTLNDELSYGLQWFFRFGSSDITLTEQNSFGSLARGFPGFSGLFSTNDVEVVVNALDSVSDLNVISSPQILVLDNQTAQLQVGDEVPIVVQQSQGLDDFDARVINSVEQRQTGVILNVTPRVNASGLVVLDIQQEVSDVVQTTTSGIDSPTISQRRIATSVAVGTDQTVALGGLIQENVQESQVGIPYLSRLPILGPLFGSTLKTKSRTELLVLITPKVVSNQQEARAVTADLRRRMQAVAPLNAKIRRDSGLHNDPLSAPEPSRPLVPSTDENAEPLALRPVKSSGRFGTDDADFHYRVQLFAADDEEQAHMAWGKFQVNLGPLLDEQDAHIEHVKKNDKSLYQLQIGRFEKFKQADDLCGEIKKSSVDCLVISRG